MQFNTDFVVVRQIGYGAFANVYEGRIQMSTNDLQPLSRECAVKFITFSEQLNSDELKRSFMQEVGMMNLLKHCPNIVTVIGSIMLFCLIK
jgi:serine/threonine protein kinase